MHNIDKFINEDDPVEEENSENPDLLIRSSIEDGDEYDELPLEEDEYEEPIPVKRKVMGRRPRMLRPTPPPELQRRELVDAGVPDFSPPIPNRQSYMMQDLRQPYYPQQQQPKTNPEVAAREQAKFDMIYARAWAKEQQKEALRNQPRISTSKKLLSVANRAAFGDPSERIQPMGIANFKSASTNSAPVIKKSVATNWNKIIADVRPKGGKINTTGTIPVKKRKNSFFGL